MRKPNISKRQRDAYARCLQPGSAGIADNGETCEVLEIVPRFEDGAAMKVKWHRTGAIGYVRPGRIV